MLQWFIVHYYHRTMLMKYKGEKSTYFSSSSQDFSPTKFFTRDTQKFVIEFQGPANFEQFLMGHMAY